MASRQGQASTTAKERRATRNRRKFEEETMNSGNRAIGLKNKEEIRGENMDPNRVGLLRHP